MSESAPRHIPENIKREVRYRCRFGCVICGLPVYHYEHIEDFAQVQGHSADNITLLCPNHHQEKTSRRLPRTLVARANGNPFNGKRDFTSEHKLFFDGNDVVFNIGSNVFGSSLSNGQYFTAIEFSKIQFAGFNKEDDSLLLNLQINDAVLNPILVIANGELSVSTGVVDVTMIGPNLVLRPKFSIKPVRISFSDNEVSINSGFFYGWGNVLEVSPDEARFSSGLTMRGCTAWGCRTGVSA